jgi:hypothetical protein
VIVAVVALLVLEVVEADADAYAYVRIKKNQNAVVFTLAWNKLLSDQASGYATENRTGSEERHS